RCRSGAAAKQDRVKWPSPRHSAKVAVFDDHAGPAKHRQAAGVGLVVAREAHEQFERGEARLAAVAPTRELDLDRDPGNVAGLLEPSFDVITSPPTIDEWRELGVARRRDRSTIDAQLERAGIAAERRPEPFGGVLAQLGGERCGLELVLGVWIAESEHEDRRAADPGLTLDQQATGERGGRA